MTVPHPASPVEPTDGVIGWSAAASETPTPEGPVVPAVPSRTGFLARFATKRVALGGAIVVVLAILAALGVFAYRTYQDLTSTKKTLAATRTTLAATQGELATTKADLSSTRTELDSTKSQLDSVSSELDSTKDDLRTAQQGVRDFFACYGGALDAVRDALDSDYTGVSADLEGIDSDCHRALEAYKAVRNAGSSV